MLIKKSRQPGYPGRAASTGVVSRNSLLLVQFNFFGYFLRKYRQSILDFEPLDLPVTQIAAQFHECLPGGVQITDSLYNARIAP